MSADPPTPPSLDRLMESFMERQRRGERPSVEEYARQYPELADAIRDVFPALAVMEEFGSAAGPDTGPYRPGEPASVPRQLGEFRLLREIGRGGMGVVYEAVQDSLGRRVALKVLPPSARADGVFLERFRREARAAARLHHTNIVPVFGVGEHDAVHYYAMQFIQGQTLDSILQGLRRFRPAELPSSTGALPVDGLSAVSRNWLAGRSGLKGPLPQPLAEAERGAGNPSPSPLRRGGRGEGPADSSSALHSSGFGQARYFRNVAEVGANVAEALAYAHGQGVIHRDIKPSNLMLDLAGTVWVTDFGLAKVEAEADLTRSGDALGTLRYMAPEQLAGAADARSDVYSLAITLYELATLRQAFDHPLRAELIDRIRYHEPVPPRNLERQVPPDLETIILKATAKDPGHRYQTAAELAEDLRRFVEDRPIRARPVGSLERGWRWCRRNPALAAALAAFVLTLTTGAAVSTSLAFVAGERADAANRHAGTAEKAANDARQSELRAQRSELETKEALEEAERTLVDSLLQPIGYEGGRPGALELTALEKLAGLSSDPVRMRFLRTGLASADTARRLGLRAEQVVRAVVGLDRQRKKAVEQLLLLRLQEQRPSRDVVLACVTLAAALRCADERLADLGTRLLVEQANRSNFIAIEHVIAGGIVQKNLSFVDQSALRRALAAADGVTVGLSPSRADAHAEAILAAIDEKTAEKRAPGGPTTLSDETNVESLALLLQRLLNRLPAERAARRADAVVTVILTTARRCTLTTRRHSGDGRVVDVVNYTTRMRMLAGFVPWLTAGQVSAQARAVVAEMRKTVTDPGTGPRLGNPSQAVRQLATGLAPLLARLAAKEAEQHAADAAGLLLSTWDQEGARARNADLADGAKELAALTPATAATPLADRLGEVLVKTADHKEAAGLAGALVAVLARLPAEPAGARADKAAEALVTLLLAGVDKPAPATPNASALQPGHRPRLDRAEVPEPFVQLANQLTLLLRALPADRAGVYATRAARGLVPTYLEAEDSDRNSLLSQAIRAIAEHLPTREALRHVQPWVPRAGRTGPRTGRRGPSSGGGLPGPPQESPRRSTRGPLLVLLLAERLPVETLLATLNHRSLPRSTATHLPLLQRRAETASAEAADSFFGLLLGAGPQGARLTEVPAVLKTLAARVSPARVPDRTNALIERMTGGLADDEWVVLVEALEVLLSRLPPDRAAEAAAKAAQAVVNRACRVTVAPRRGSGRTPTAFVEFDGPLRVLARRLSAAQAGEHVETLLSAMDKVRQADDLCRVVRSILALVDRLPPPQARNVLARAVPPLLPALSKAASASEFASIARTLDRVGDRFPVRTGEEHVRAAMQFVEKTKRGFELPPLAEAYRVVLNLLPADAAATHAGALAGHIVRAADQTKSPLDLMSLARSLRSIGRHLPPGSKQPEAFADLLFRTWDEAPEEVLSEQLGEAIQAVAALLPPNQAGRSADRVLAALAKASLLERRGLAEVHEALVERLPDDQARPRRVAAIRAGIHLEAVGNPPGSAARATLPEYLSPLVTACTPGDLVDVLRSPACTGDVQGWFLAELGRRCRCEFRSVWEVASRLEQEGALGR